MKPSNPFVISGYLGAKYFCDREKEVKLISEAIANQRNITLYSFRRMGKSVLVQHVLGKMERQGYQCLFLDIYSTSNLKHFLQKLSEAVSAAKIKGNELLIMRILKSLGASLSIDPLSGLPSLDLTLVSKEKVYASLHQIFSMLAEQSKKIVIAIDEFQEVLNYTDDINVEAEIRSITQAYPNIVFLFSGSQKHLMLDMFSNARRPFFQSTQMVELNEIGNDLYMKFILTRLKEYGKLIDSEVTDLIMEDSLRHTFYTHYLLNRLFGSAREKIDLALYNKISGELANEQETLAHSYRKMLTKQQWQLLKAFAYETFVKQPLGHSFQVKYGLPASSSIARSLRSLMDKDLIIDCGDSGLRIFDVFLMRYLQKSNLK